MKILVICQRYWPEQFQVTDICESLVDLGHEVTVLTGLPNVGLEGSPNVVPEEYKDRANWQQVHNGVRIVRSLEISRKTGVLNRVLNYYSFWISSKRTAKRMNSDFDVVFAYQLSPCMMADAALTYKKMYGVPVVLYCCDLWPESLKAWLGNRFGFVVSYFGKVCKRIYSECDVILIQSPAFLEYFLMYHQIEESRIDYLPQFATDDFHEVELTDEHDGVNLLFMGNMGRVQGIDCMLEALDKLRDIDGLKMHFVGDGEVLPKAKKYVETSGLQNMVCFHGRRPHEEMESFYRISDLCVFALDDSSSIGLTIPSKLQGYMAAGKPVLGACGGGAAEVLIESGAGHVIPFGDSDSMARQIRSFCSGDASWQGCGAAGQQYFVNNFTRESFMLSLTDSLLSVANKER